METKKCMGIMKHLIKKIKIKGEERMSTNIKKEIKMKEEFINEK